jgi:exonuclease SbcC
MRPNKLTIEGFTCFRQRAEIDFSDLDLFAITGATGSGKTSIIDAITYALYGQTARLGAKNLSELITQGAPRLSVKLEFDCGGKHYRIARVLKRSGPASVRLEILGKDGEHTVEGGAREIAAQIARIVGIDFDAFTKAVVLPQGQFDEFLRGESADRRKILEVLLNLGVYRDMMQLANARHKEKQTARDIINEQLQREYLDATPENHGVLEQEVEGLNENANAVNAQIARLDDLRTPSIELRQKRVLAVNSQAQCDSAEQHIVNEQNAQKKTAGELERQETNLELLERALKQVPYKEEIHQKLLALRPVAQQLEKAERERTEKVEEKSIESAELEKLEKKLEPAKQNAKERADKSQAASRAYDAAKDKFAALKKKYGAVEAVEQVAAEIKGIDELQEQLETDQQRQTILEKNDGELKERIEKLKTEEAQAKRLWAEAKAVYEHLVRKHSAEDLRKHLQTGAPCPVCDQTVNRLPKRLATAGRDDSKSAAEQRQDAWQKKQRTLNKAESDLEALPSQLQSAKSDVKRTSKQIADLTKKAERILGKAPAKDAAATLERIAAELRDAEADCDLKEERREEAAEGEASAKDVLADLERTRAVFVEKIRATKKQIEHAATEIANFRLQLKGVGDIKSIQTELAAQEKAKLKLIGIQQEIQQARKMRDGAQKQHHEISATIAGLKGTLDALNRTVADAKSEAEHIERNLKKKLAGLVLPKGMDEAEQIDKFLTDLRRRCSELTGQVEQRKARIDQLEMRIAEAEHKRAQVAELDETGLLYAKLGNLLRADQFIQFILEGAFDLLSSEGTRQLTTLSQGRYSFHTEGNEFQVIDHWNADDRRSVRTLSGGESFLASLALALALSSSVSQFADGGGPFKLDALFLDEGFSTLDAETLNVAVEAIQALQQDDRMIAVISHVTDLAERLPSRIQVVKGISGSEIKLDQGLAAATS